MTEWMAHLLAYWTGLVLHEAAHALAATLCGMRVRKLYLWLDVGGAALFRLRTGGLEIGIGCLPLGAYTEIEGAQLIGQESWPDEEHEFTARAKWQQVLVLLAGPAVNLIAAAVLFLLGAPAPLVWVQMGMAMVDLIPAGQKDASRVIAVLCRKQWDRDAAAAAWWLGWVLTTVLLLTSQVPG